MTKMSDKLPAIAGLARAFHMRFSTKMDYLAGIWYQDAIQGLAWRQVDHIDYEPDPGVSRPSPSRAPSFSWAACDRPIFFERYFRQAHSTDAVALAFHTELRGRDVFGEVLSASITLRDYTQSLTSCFFKERYKAYPQERYHYSHNKITIDDPEKEMQSSGDDALVLHLFAGHGSPSWICSAGFAQSVWNQYCLFLVPANAAADIYCGVGFMTRGFPPFSGREDMLKELGSWANCVVRII